ncbi:DUF2326 domain-containing protein [bacterium]|nr:DUF2326 domain-containing protein [bacterium]MBU1754047.1 DUF2326 domain-containing protein [bacterium]
MKISKIYANKQFKNIEFNEDFNVIIGRIFDKSKKEKDTHNLGKSALIDVIDFLLLKKFDKTKHLLGKSVFRGQIFFAELLLNNWDYLIIRRGADNPTKISFKLNDFKSDGFKQDFDWDEEDLPFDKAKERLNEYLGFDVLRNWQYRTMITYFLRTQQDFLDVFKLNKFKGRDKDWKPMMFNMLGFDSEIVRQKTDLEDAQNELKQQIHILRTEAQIDTKEKDKMQGLLDIKKDEQQKTEEQINRFNFFEKDKNINQELVENIDTKIQTLNTQRYSIDWEINKINHSLSLGVNSINLNELIRIYKEVEIYFPDNLMRNYQQLINFNESITQERNKFLKENLQQLKEEQQSVNNELRVLENRKEELLSYLTEKDSYAKFKEIQKQLASIVAEIMRLEDKLKAMDIVGEKEDGLKKIKDALENKAREIRNLIGEQKHAEIRKTFNSIISAVLNVPAIISIAQNKEGNVDFSADCQSPRDLEVTAEGEGTTYGKLLCMAFDLSILIHYSKNSFFRFVYHDGALEGLDDRKKNSLLQQVKKICREHNIQYIFTLIDTDLPRDENDQIVDFSDNEICLELHDKDDSGRLFGVGF